ncbi:MAG: nickel pincer cofactor biosynthesis protein LarC [Acidobacteriota bacterium]
MARVLHIDPFGGAAGDMLLGALLDAGAGEGELTRMLAGLGLTGWRLTARRDRQQGFAGTRVAVEVEEESHPARRLRDVSALLAGASLPEAVRRRAQSAFGRLFEAEALAHGVPLEQAHLHELAAVDAVIDIVGTCAAVELLGVGRITCGPVPVGSGTVQTQHGLLPVPGPAVATLLAGAPLAGHAAEGEMTTPTGAVLLVTLAEAFGSLPAGRLERVGVGLGTRKFPGLPNLLRAFVVEEEVAPVAGGRAMVLIEATVDDASGETLGHVVERLRDAGALDAWILAGTGRKGRPVSELRALALPEARGEVLAALFEQGATLGARVIACERPELERRMVAAATPYGEIPVKLGLFRSRVVSAKPEHDACAAAATAHGVSLAAVEASARAAAPKPGDPA